MSNMDEMRAMARFLGAHCPTCDSPNPAHHPAVQFEGEVHLCENPWHQPTAAEIRAREERERQRDDIGQKP